MDTRPQEVQAGPENEARNSFPLTHSFLLTEVPSWIPSALVPQGSWAQPPAQQWSGTCFFWEGTLHSGGDQPSRVRVGAQPYGGRGGRGRLSSQPPSSPPLPVAAKAVQRFESGGDGSPGRGAPRQRLLLLEVIDKKVSVWSRAEVGSSVTSLILTPISSYSC